jgi:hypothetical protein
MSASPRLFSERGKFLPLTDEMEAALKALDADRFARYVALKDAALAYEAAQAAVTDTEARVAAARTSYQNTIKSRDRQFPKLTQNDLAKAFAKTEHVKRAISRGVLPVTALHPSPTAAADRQSGNNLLHDFNRSIKQADELVADTLRELADARVAARTARATLGACWSAHVSKWPSLTPEENQRARIKSEQDRRRKEAAGRNQLGDSFETQQFVAKQMQTGNHRGATSKINLMRARAELQRKQREAGHGGGNN